MTGRFHLFAYGALGAAGGGGEAPPLRSARRLAPAEVAGTLYDTEMGYPAMVLGGGERVHGEVWECPTALLWDLDRYEGVEDGLFRRVGVRVGDYACWTYVAGPELSRLLTPDRRIAGGRWAPAG